MNAKTTSSVDDSPAELRAYGREQAHRPEWGPSPPLWLTAATQADWEAEAYLVSHGVPDPNAKEGSA